jgi:hypothetical protein
MRIANQTAEMLTKIVGQINDISSLVGSVANASAKQAVDISSVNSGIERISQVTQANSAASQQGASSSQELSSQAETFKSMVEQFKLSERSKTAQSTSFHSKPRTAPPGPPRRPAGTSAPKSSAPAFKPAAVSAPAPAEVKPKPAAKTVDADNAPSLTVRQAKGEVLTKLPKGDAKGGGTFFSSYDSTDFGKYS